MDYFLERRVTDVQSGGMDNNSHGPQPMKASPAAEGEKALFMGCFLKGRLRLGIVGGLCDVPINKN